MNDKVEQSQTQASDPLKPMLDEFNYLKDHGEDFSDLQAGLEQVLKDHPDLRPEPASLTTQPPTEFSYDSVLPVNLNGEEVEVPEPAPKTAEEPSPTPSETPPAKEPAKDQLAPEKKTAQEEALDPYKPDGVKDKSAEAADEDYEPGAVTVDQEGRIRDAKTGKYVPHQALHAEREKNKELRAELEKRRETEARAEERLAMLTQIVEGQQKLYQEGQDKQDQPEEEQEIDPKIDIFAAFEQLKKQNNALRDQLNETRTNTNKQYSQIQMAERYRQDATKFASDHSDFFEAYRYLLDTRKAELEVLGYSDQNAIAAQIAAEERALVQNELSKPGGTPAKKIYDLARAKGYRKPEPKPDPTPAPPPVEAAPAKPKEESAPKPANAAEKLKNIQNGAQAHASLSGHGGTPSEGLSIRQLADMSDEKFLEFAAKIGKDKLDKLLRG